MKFIVALLLSVSSVAFATTEKQFSKKVLSVIAEGQSSHVEVSLNTLTPEEKGILTQHASKLSGIWRDTVLQGNVVLDPSSDLELYFMTKVFDKNGNFIAYRLNFGHIAYDTKSCNYDFIAGPMDPLFKAVLDDRCVEAVIESAAFISPDLKYAIHDPEQVGALSN